MTDHPPVLRHDSQPYGPATTAIRRFLVRLAALGTTERAQACMAYAAAVDTRRWQRAETALAAVMERSGRGAAQEAVSGPLLQLVHRPEIAPLPDTASPDEAIATLDPVAEPALAALLALIVRDLLEPAMFATLYAPMDEVIPVDTLDA